MATNNQRPASAASVYGGNYAPSQVTGQYKPGTTVTPAQKAAMATDPNAIHGAVRGSLSPIAQPSLSFPSGMLSPAGAPTTGYTGAPVPPNAPAFPTIPSYPGTPPVNPPAFPTNPSTYSGVPSGQLPTFPTNQSAYSGSPAGGLDLNALLSRLLNRAPVQSPYTQFLANLPMLK